jgi:hypothetical protein
MDAVVARIEGADMISTGRGDGLTFGTPPTA